MKRAPSKGGGMKRPPPASVDQYLARLPKDARASLGKVRSAVRSAAPGAEEVIRYRMPVYKFQGRMLVGFAAFTDHLSFFVMSTGVMRAHAAALKRYDTAAGTIRFPVDKPLPAALVRKLVRARIAENAKSKTR